MSKLTLIKTENQFSHKAEAYLVGEKAFNGRSDFRIVITNLFTGKTSTTNFKRKLYNVRGSNQYVFDYGNKSH